jgi:hypothetical protein
MNPSLIHLVLATASHDERGRRIRVRKPRTAGSPR